MTKKGREVATNSTRVVFRLPSAMQHELAISVTKNGYGLRGKSRWVNEAVVDFLNDSAWFDQIESDRQGERNASEEVRLEKSTLTAINKAIKKIKSDRPIFTSPRSTIIRCAIHYRLLGLDTHLFQNYFQKVSQGD